MIINVDCDGVLVPNTHEESLFERIERENFSFDNSSVIWDWYSELINTQPLPLNLPLLSLLQKKKDEGDVIRLWTNRGYTLKSATLDNLGEWTSLFDSFMFFSGLKHLSRVEGICVDNHKRYLSCGEMGGIQYKYGGEV